MTTRLASFLLFSAALVLSFLLQTCQNSSPTVSTPPTVIQQDSLLRHVVLFKFKPDASSVDISKVEEAFNSLPDKIPQIVDYEWGLNNSPEGLEKGFTHCFFLTFKNEADRAIYLPHPDHKAFGDIVGPVLEDVLVVDYWIN